jgi:hypothetical protein
MREILSGLLSIIAVLTVVAAIVVLLAWAGIGLPT